MEFVFRQPSTTRSFSGGKSNIKSSSKMANVYFVHSPVCFARYGECAFFECFFAWFQSVSCLW